MKKVYHLKQCMIFALLFIAGVVFCGADTAKADESGVWTYSKYNNEATITKYSGLEKDVEIPADFEGIKVVSIGYSCFQGNEKIETVSVPDTVEVIDSYSFYGCKNLVRVSGTENVTYIDDYAFYGCSKLNAIPFGNKLSVIDYEAFYDCSSLTGCVLPDSLQEIGGAAFYRSGLTQIEIPAGVAVDSNAFSYCASLVSAKIGKDTNISSGMFSGCKALETVEIEEEGIAYISDYAFSSCESLEEIILPKSVRRIGGSAFTDCTALRSVGLSYGLLEIRNSAFSGDSALSSITIPNSVTKVDSSAFYGCTALEQITIPRSVTSMGNAFFGNQVTKICYYPGSYAETYVTENYGEARREVLDVSNPITSLEFDAEVVEVEVDSVLQIPYSVSPSVEETTDAIVWTSGNTSYVTVNGIGEISGRRVGTGVQISAATSGGIEKLIEVVVTDRPGSMRVWAENSNIRQGETVELKTKVSNTTGGELSGCEIDFSSSDTEVASVSASGVVTGLKPGTATITAKVQGRDVTASCQIYVKSSQIISITIPSYQMSLRVGNTGTRTATLRDELGIRTDVKPSYSSSNTNIATVDANGTVTGRHAGTTAITARIGELTASYTVVVSGTSGSGNSNQQTTVSFSSTSKATILAGKTVMRKASVRGLSAKLTYVSSNPNIARVNGSSGEVTGVNAGTVTITARAGNASASYKVEVVMAQLSKNGKTLTITTLPKAKLTVKASKKILGKASKKVTANKKGIAKVKFKKSIKGNVKVTVTKSGYKKSTMKKKF